MELTTTLLGIALAGTIIYLIKLIGQIGKLKTDLYMLYIISEEKLDKKDSANRAIPFGYMLGARDAFKKLEEYF